MDKQEPAAETVSEFVNKWREKLKNTETLYKMGKKPDEWFESIVKGFRASCHRLEAETKRADDAEKEIDRLEVLWRDYEVELQDLRRLSLRGKNIPHRGD